MISKFNATIQINKEGCPSNIKKPLCALRNYLTKGQTRFFDLDRKGSLYMGSATMDKCHELCEIMEKAQKLCTQCRNENKQYIK
ncbi:MAG: hypothetical protein J5679_03470 [Alphaproteobacteria bacterium]|nr:hypothetical protein [Alphaproteobacteria bacterium]